MTVQPSPSAFVVLHITTTCDEQHSSRDPGEILEVAWSAVDSESLDEIISNSSLVKPLSSPVTSYCTSQTSLTWDSVKNAPSLKECLSLLEQDIEEHLVSQDISFTFVVFNSWDLRMRLPKETREKGIQLPAYLERSRHFDLKKEYIKNQQYISLDPEQYLGLNLTQICTSLGIEVADIQPVNESYGQSLSLAMPRRAGDEVRLLLKLIDYLQKNSPAAANVLQSPHDMALDLEHFDLEKSRVLYMSNLPLDTTQSSLETWFTQYGGRPMAFWSIKSPVSDTQNSSRAGSVTSASSRSNSVGSQSSSSKSTCTGFVVFSSHEDARDSLAMTGRVFNDKIIEVQPSSASILDKAQEILAPFPSSKNRPRPGDWNCPSCGFSNFQRRTACFRCSFPAASAAAVQESLNSNHYHNRQNNANGTSNVFFRAGDWICPLESCSYHNFAKNVTCLKCGAPKLSANTHSGYNYHQDAYNANLMQRRPVTSSQYHTNLRPLSAGSDTSAPGAGALYHQMQYGLPSAGSKPGSQPGSSSNTPLFQPMLSQGASQAFTGTLHNFQGLSSRISGLSLNPQPILQNHTESHPLYHSGSVPLNLDLDLSK
ncbi:hypothetical protein OGAPHI_000658 [Ogataea philodendri]|uniref:Uncharacterized protein n=1 Tax=Ogataea philodendri TaxID=1378263 RepID=A0A9P8PGQ0_9ASCO|nr:uncharacterized protein OGAPHI_000658 [Ogataea philodendri]KAH3670947.1 hypothetical protein OGAPHI_000658 [Ogataea philodendri]